jgi:hypothetical protein
MHPLKLDWIMNAVFAPFGFLFFAPLRETSSCQILN